MSTISGMSENGGKGFEQGGYEKGIRGNFPVIPSFATTEQREAWLDGWQRGWNNYWGVKWKISELDK